MAAGSRRSRRALGKADAVVADANGNRARTESGRDLTRARASMRRRVAFAPEQGCRAGPEPLPRQPYEISRAVYSAPDSPLNAFSARPARADLGVISPPLGSRGGGPVILSVSSRSPSACLRSLSSSGKKAGESPIVGTASTAGNPWRFLRSTKQGHGWLGQRPARSANSQ